MYNNFFFFFSSRRRHTRSDRDWSSDVCSSDLSQDDIELARPRHRWLTRSTVPVRGVGGEYLGRLVVYADVTEQRELDRQRSDFLTVAAHELRTPLTPLSMYLQSIDRRLARGQQV